MTKGGKKTLTAKDLEVVNAAQIANIIRKAKAGRVLSQREENILAHAVPTSKKAIKPSRIPAEEDQNVWLTPAEFERWLQGQGISISHKNLYRSYLGKGARHPLERSAAGKIHKEKALELIRLIQGREEGDAARIITERQAADARYKAAKARAAELALEAELKLRVPTALVEKVWGRAFENFKSELRTIEHNLPDDLEGKPRAEMQAILAKAHHEALKHLMINLGDAK